MTEQSQFGRTPAKSAVLAVRFFTEVALLFVLAVVGAKAGTPLAGQIALAVGCPLLAAAIWGVAIAPQARRRLPDPWRLGVEIVLFGAASAGLAIETGPIGAVIFAVVAIGVAVLVRFVAPGG